MKTVTVSQYNPEWVPHFEALKANIWPSISDVAESIEHVGSTSVPHLAAKPIIDLTIVVSTAENLKVVIDRLSELGVDHLGDLGIVGREAFSQLEGHPNLMLLSMTVGFSSE